jgi:PAS domain S-box-containing protein
MVFCKDKDITFLESKINRGHEEPHCLLAAIEEASDGILIADSSRIVRYVNSAFEKMSGFAYGEIVDKKAEMIWSEYNEKTFPDNLWSSLDQGISWNGRMTNRRKDGSLYELETKISVVRDYNENITHFVNINRDLTHETLLEKQLLQAQKMQAIGTLAGGIAHDFNNILSAIMGYTEICMLQAPKDTQIPRRLGRVMHACQRARELVKQILTFSRQTKQEHNQVQIHLIIKEALKLLRASLPSTIEIQHEIRTDSSYVLADPTQIHQVLMNLCTNAAHAMKENGGKLSVKLDDVNLENEIDEKFSSLNPGSYVRLTVNDTGHGMNDHTLSHMFEPFFTTKNFDEGTGMGLAVVKSIVENHGGAVYAYSELEKGSTFEVLFPRATMEPILEKKSSAHLPQGNERILLVDDEEFIVDMAKEMLEGLGYIITTTNSSPEALKWVDQSPHDFDLVITDQTMPGMTGTELADRIHNIRNDLSIILCTGYSEEIIPGRAESQNIKSVIMKPFIIQEMALVVRKVLDSR